ncbi:hypothetical protein CEB3_c19650 [Peptococcaceae bacterium CEB3]|nr:hypothetical protein CEB3_c19650 [Peptococcaceae bacterium CEB3]
MKPNTIKKAMLALAMVMAMAMTLVPTRATAAGLSEGVAPDGTVTSAWGGVTWPPVISGWTWVPPAGNFAFLMTSRQEKAIHTGDEYSPATAAEFKQISSNPAMTEPNSIAWIKYAYDHGGGKTLPFSWKFYWAPAGSGSLPGYDPNHPKVGYATVTPQIAQLLAANGLTLAELRAGEPLSTPAPASAPAKVQTKTTPTAPTQPQIQTQTTTPAETTTVADSTVTTHPTLPKPPAKGNLSPAANPDSQTSKDIALYNANAAKVKAQNVARTKAEAQHKKVRTYELWAIAGLAVLLVALLGLLWVRKRNLANSVRP